MNRTAWLSLILLGLLASGIAVQRWPAEPLPSLPCPPSELRLDAEGVARCDLSTGGTPLAAEALLGVGGRLDLNRAPEADLARIPGVGRALARALVEEREALGAFADWDEVGAVRGVGPSKLRALQASAEIR